MKQCERETFPMKKSYIENSRFATSNGLVSAINGGTSA
jgi:hypothetical protein